MSVNVRSATCDSGGRLSRPIAQRLEKKLSSP